MGGPGSRAITIHAAVLAGCAPQSINARYLVRALLRHLGADVEGDVVALMLGEHIDEDQRGLGGDRTLHHLDARIGLAVA